MRLHLDGFSQLRNGLVITARKKEGDAKIGIDNQGERIELLRTFELSDCGIEIANDRWRPVSIPMVGSGVIRIQRNRAFELVGRGLKIQIVKQQDLPKRRVRLGEGAVEFES